MDNATDGLYDRIEFKQYIAVRESKHSQPRAFEEGGAFGVSHRSFWFEMLTAIDFYDQPQFEAVEVEDVVAEGKLPAELHAELAIPQDAPQPRFCVGGISSEASGACSRRM